MIRLLIDISDNAIKFTDLAEAIARHDLIHLNVHVTGDAPTGLISTITGTLSGAQQVHSYSPTHRQSH